MARPVTLVSAALLTAAAAAAAGILPQLTTLSSGESQPPPAVTLVLSQPAGQPSPSAAQSSIPAPPGIGTTAGGATTTATGFYFVPAMTSQSGAQVSSLSPDNNVAFRSSEAAYVGNLPLRSSSGCQQALTFEVIAAQDRNGDVLRVQLDAPTAKALTVPPFSIVNASLRLSLLGAADGSQRPLLPANGWLRFLAEPTQIKGDACRPTTAEAGKEPKDLGYQYVTFTIPEPPPDSAYPLRSIFFGSLGAAVIALLIAAWRLRKAPRVSLCGLMGGATWSFQQSWGSNVTIGAGILSSLLTLIAFPAHPQIMDKNSYSLLQGLFLAVVALAPLVYGLIRPDVQDGSSAPAAAQGYVYMFLFAGTLVLWAALGQVMTLGVLVEEFKRALSLDAYLGCALIGLAVILFLLLVVYGVRALYQTPRRLSMTGTGSVVQPPPPPPPGLENATTKGVETTKAAAPPEWPLL
jgi:hypothetical protein